ncbi:MAG: GEVED domain-containing protein [Bacteroidota bacterium]
MKKKLILLNFTLLLAFTTSQLKAQNYCTTGLYNNACSFGDYLTSFSFGTINQTSLICPSSSGDTIGYNSYIFDTTKLILGTTYIISGTLGASPDDHIRIWIDYNNDGVFDNSTELIYDSGNIAANAFSDTTNIPLTANLGIHRMRVRVVYNYLIPIAFDACSNYSYGCTNDYIVNVISVTNPYITVSPISFNFGYVAYEYSSTSQQFNISGNNLTVITDSILIKAPIGFQVSLSPGVNYDSTVVIQYSGTSLPLTSIYVMFVPTQANTVYSANLTFVGGGASCALPLSGTSLFTYCITNLYSLGCTNGNYLTTFNFTSINQTGLTCPNSTGDIIAYNDYTSNSTIIKRGDSYSISGALGTSLDDNVKVWIDYNDDNIFDNSTETIYNSGAFSGSSFSGNVSIPIDAPLGIHRMRVRTVYDLSDFDACTQYTNGCVNDYLVNIQKHGPDVGITSINVPANAPIGSIINPVLTVHNFGDTTVTSMPFYYKYCNEPLMLYNWTGTLNPGQSDSFNIPDLFVQDSNISLCAWTALIGDVNLFNDTACLNTTAVYANNVGVTKIISPSDSAVVGTYQKVKIMIKNKGLTTATSIPVAYQRGIGTIINETWTGSLAYNDSVVYTFIDSLAVPTGVSFSLCAWTKLIGDQDTLNDKTCKTVQITMGINENTANGSINISPNPAHDKLNINCNNIKNGKTIFTIYNVEGIKLFNEETIITTDNYINTINVNKFKSGIYFLRIENGNNIFNRKIIIE